MRTSDAQRCLGLEHLLWYDLNTSSCCISPRNASRFAPRHNQIVGMSKNEPPRLNRLLIARLTARSKKVDTLASEDRLTECPSSIRSLHCSPVLQQCLWSTRSSPPGVAWSLKFPFPGVRPEGSDSYTSNPQELVAHCLSSSLYPESSGWRLS